MSLAAGKPGWIPANAQEVESLLPFVVLLLTIGPVFSAILLSALLNGRAGLREFLVRVGQYL